MLILLFVVVDVDDVVVAVGDFFIFFFPFYRPKWGLLSMQCMTRSFDFLYNESAYRVTANPEYLNLGGIFILFVLLLLLLIDCLNPWSYYGCKVTDWSTVTLPLTLHLGC